VIQEVLDNIFQSNAFERDILVYGIFLIGAMFLGKEILNCLRIRVNNKLEQKVIFKIRKDLHDKLLDLPISFYDRRKSGEIASRVVEDVQNVERAILDGTEQGVIALLTLTGRNKHDVYSRTPLSFSGIFTSANSSHPWF
jgi:ABC-type multidrug transport system fused ATPase/permease subunit